MRKRTSNMGSARELTRGEHETSPIADAVSVGAVDTALQLDRTFPVRHSVLLLVPAVVGADLRADDFRCGSY